jgi:hypothetical protein
VDDFREVAMDHECGPMPSSVLLWLPSGFADPERRPGRLSTVCCLRSTTAGSRAVVYRSARDQGIAGLFDFVSDARPQVGGGWAADGVLHLLDPALPRADLLADPCLSPVFTHLQGRRRLSGPAARRLVGLLTTVPFAAPLP